MTSKDNSQDQELLDRYRRASDTDAAAPSDSVRSAILAESRRVAAELAAKQPAAKQPAAGQHAAGQLAAGKLAAQGSPPPFDVSRPAANDSRWKITAFGTAGAALLAALLIAPRYWESLPGAQQDAVPTAAPPAAPAAAPESKSSNADAASQPTATSLARNAAPPAKLESIAPSRRAESLAEMPVSPESAALLDGKMPKAAQNYAAPQDYAPAPPVALKPARPAPAAPPPLVAQAEPVHATNSIVPAPSPPSADSAQKLIAGAPAAPTADSVQNIIGGRWTNTDPAGATLGAIPKSAARAARERDALEPISLQSASAAGDLAQATSLLDQGAAVDARDAQGRTPLLIAVAQNRLEVVRLLLARGADPNAADNAGLTPLQQAKNNNLRDMAALLERAGAR